MAGQIITKITADGGTHLVSSSFYGTCETAADEAAKIVKLVDTHVNAATFVTGMALAVKFTYNNTIASPTLTVQTNGGTQIMAAKNIYRYGTTRPSTNNATSWIGGSIVLFVYDGSGWQEVHSYDNNDNTVPSVYISTAAATAAKVGTLTGGALRKGYYCCNITASNTSETALTLNINGKGAKDIYINGSASSTSNYTLPAGFYIVYYNGTNFYFRTDGKIPQLITSGSITKTTGDSVTVTAGTAASLKYTSRSIPNVTSVGSKPSLTTETVAAGTALSKQTSSVAGATSVAATSRTNYATTTDYCLTIAANVTALNNSTTLTTTSIKAVDEWSAGSTPTLGTAISADDITEWTTNTPTAVTKKTVVTAVGEVT